MAHLVKNPSAVLETWIRSLGWTVRETWVGQCGRPGFDPWVGKIPWRRERLPTPVFWPGEDHGVTNSWTQRSDFHFSFHDSRAASLSVVPLLFYSTKLNLCWAITNRQRVCLVVTSMASLDLLSEVSSRFYSEHHLSLERAAGS